ncbi:MAG: serine protease [Planctomycetia bacterium]|nr:serine protease [Planctomycetia bacterium]
MNQKFIITCAHLFEEGENAQIWIYFPGAGRCQAELHSVDRTWDLAILDSPTGWTIQGATLPPAVPLGESTPKQGETLFFAGYGSNGTFRCVAGNLLGYCAVGKSKNCETLVVSGQARLGDSGGPIFNSNGELVGVLWGTDGRTICGSYNGRIVKFLATAFPTPPPSENPEQKPIQDERLFPRLPFRNEGTEPLTSVLTQILQELRNMQQPTPLTSPTSTTWVIVLIVIYIVSKKIKDVLPYLKSRTGSIAAATTGDAPA